MTNGAMLSRRNLLLAGLGGAGLTAFSSASLAQERRLCRAQGFPTVRQCLQTCDEGWPTLQCQIRSLFPIPEQLRNGVVIGAILGGVVGWITGGDIEDALAGAVLGGVVGGIAQAASTYRQHQATRARGDNELAYRTTTADLTDDRWRVSALAIDATVAQVTHELAHVSQQIQRVGDRALSAGVVATFSAANSILGATSAANSNSETAMDVGDDTASWFASRTGRGPTPPDTLVRTHLRNASSLIATTQRTYQALQSHPALRAALQ